MRFTGLRLRYWAFRQCLYERKTQPKDCSDAVDFARARRQLFLRSVVGGHLDDRCFVSMEADFPDLGRPGVLEDDEAVLRIARRHLERYRLMGRVASGVLEGYLLAQRDHLASCPRCRRSVCEAVRKDMADCRSIRSLLREVGDDGLRRIADDFLPAGLRRRGDPTLN